MIIKLSSLLLCIFFFHKYDSFALLNKANCNSESAYSTHFFFINDRRGRMVTQPTVAVVAVVAAAAAAKQAFTTKLKNMLHIGQTT